MVARFHYDEDVLERFLRDRLRGDEGTVAAHIEVCETCQLNLEAVSQAEFSWDELPALLRPDSSDGTSVQDLSGLLHGGDSGSVSLSFLQPSARGNSLGRFGRYEILEILGRGGMGIVMRGVDSALDRQCAIKVLAPEFVGSAAARKRFSREARSAAAVVHPHVVPIQTVDEHERVPYLVMPVIEGPSLQQRVEQDGPLEVIEVVRIATQVGEGLSAAHSQGLVHRDIKPANVLLENGIERVQITDFGLARAVDDASMTRSGVIAGTPQYMSPEQAHGDTIDHRSDLFSLGSVMYFMLTGRSPFRAETSMGVLNRICNDQPRSLRSINAEVPEWLESIVMRLLAKSPGNRFQSADEVAKVLADHLVALNNPDSGNPPQLADDRAEWKSQQTSPATPPHRFRKLLLAVGFAFFILAGVVFYLETDKGTLRIESNSEIDVPLRIIRGDETVDEITVGKDGDTTRLKAGSYVIEVDDADAHVEVQGERFTIRRGDTWTVSISPVAKFRGAGQEYAVERLPPFSEMLGSGAMPAEGGRPIITVAHVVLERGRPFPTLKQMESLTPLDSFETEDGLPPWPRFRLSIHPDGTLGFQASPITLNSFDKLPFEKLIKDGRRLAIEAHVDVPINRVKEVVAALNSARQLQGIRLHLFEYGHHGLSTPVPQTFLPASNDAADEPIQREAEESPSGHADSDVDDKRAKNASALEQTLIPEANTNDARANRAVTSPTRPADSTDWSAADTDFSNQVILEMTLSEETPTPGGSKVLAEPTVAVTLGRPFAYHAGGDLHTGNSGDGPEIGTHVEGTVKKHTGDLFLVELKLVVGNGIINAGNPEMELVNTQTLNLRTTLRIGEEKQFNCGRSRVLKIYLQPIPAAKVESGKELPLQTSSPHQNTPDIGKPIGPSKMIESESDAIASEAIHRNVFQDKEGWFAPQTLPWRLVVPQNWAIIYPAGDSRSSASRRIYGGALAHVESQKSFVCINQAGSLTDQSVNAVDVDLRFAAVSPTLPAAMNGQRVSMELTEDDLEAATKGTVTKFFYAPYDLPSGDGRPSIGVLTMGAVTANQRKEVIDNLSKRGTFVADMVIRLSSAKQEKPLEP